MLKTMTRNNVGALPPALLPGPGMNAMQVDLFGEMPASEIARQRLPTTRKTEAATRDVSGGLFALNDTLGPDRFSAVFCSGASAHYDALGLIEAGKAVGVVAGLIPPRVMLLLRNYLREGGKLFCDSGAYGKFKKWSDGKAESPVVDFEQVLSIYDALIESLAPEVMPNVALVMPDVVRDQSLSFELLRKYRTKVCAYIANGVNTIVPIQKGPMRAGDSVRAITEILGVDNYAIGIPSAGRAAMSLSDIATIRCHQRFHILGRGAMGIDLYRRAYAFLEHNPGATISCDANQIRTKMRDICDEQTRLITENEGAIWQGQYDDTELIADVLDGCGWLSPGRVKALAQFYGITKPAEVKKWIAQHQKCEGLRPLIEERDPEGDLLWQVGLRSVFGELANDHLSARMRGVAVANVFAEVADRQIPACA